MSKLKEWEYDDAMHDYLKLTEELEELENEDEPDEDEIMEVKDTIAEYEDILFSDDLE